jgi:hypothetical protein
MPTYGGMRLVLGIKTDIVYNRVQSDAGYTIDATKKQKFQFMGFLSTNCSANELIIDMQNVVITVDQTVAGSTPVRHLVG